MINVVPRIVIVILYSRIMQTLSKKIYSRPFFWKHKFRREKKQGNAKYYENIQINCYSVYVLLFSSLRLFDFKDVFSRHFSQG